MTDYYSGVLDLQKGKKDETLIGRVFGLMMAVAAR
jgi:hypothetical protein